jgi:hypothetical protein
VGASKVLAPDFVVIGLCVVLDCWDYGLSMDQLACEFKRLLVIWKFLEVLKYL